MNNKLIVVILAAAAAIIGYVLLAGKNRPENPPTNGTAGSFEECAAKGFPIEESYPRKCKTPDGETFTENIGNSLAKMDFIRVDNPKPNTVVKSPLEITGKARGTWYFEASFPVRIVDADNNELGISHAEAQGEWMTENFVPFKATLEFSEPQTDTGTLILEKDNPSGLSENADQLAFPIRFK